MTSVFWGPLNLSLISSPTSFSATLIHRSPDSDSLLRNLVKASFQKSVSRAINRLNDVLLLLLTEAQATEVLFPAEKSNVALILPDIHILA